MAAQDSLRGWVDQLPLYSTARKRKLVEDLEAQRFFTVGDLKAPGSRDRLDPQIRYNMSAAGFFATRRSNDEQKRARIIANSIAAIPSVDFEQVRVFDKLPWPSLGSRVQRVQSGADGIWLVGRALFKPILIKFMGDGEVKIDLDGNAGSGKTYLLLMLSLHCLHNFSKQNERAERKCRLVCIFQMPQDCATLLTVVRKALLVAFADDAESCNWVSCIRDWEEMWVLVDHLKETNDFFFVVDEYNVLDSRLSNTSIMNVWETLTKLEQESTCLHGGSAKRDEAYDRVFKSTRNDNYHCKYTAFTCEELQAYLSGKGLSSEPAELQALTGALPLLVRIFVDSYLSASGALDRDNEARKRFLADFEVEFQRRSLVQWVMGKTDLSTDKRKAALAGLSNLLLDRGMVDVDIFDPRWIVQRGNNFGLVSELAKEIVLDTVDVHFEKAEGHALMLELAKQLIEECSAGLMVDRLVIHIAKERGIGPLSGKKIESYHYFDIKLGPILTHEPTTYIPKSWQHRRVDFATRRMERGLLLIDSFQLSLGIHKGIAKWQSADKFFEAENMGLYTGGFELQSIRWGFHWIGRDEDKPDWYPSRHCSSGSVRYKETYLVSSAVANPAEVDGAFVRALASTSSLKRN